MIIAGLSGTGKSAIAASLHTRTGFAHINSDVVRKRLAGVPAETRRLGPYGTGLYTQEHSARTYRTMFAEAAEHLTAGRGAILDATFQRRVGRDTARQLAAQHGVPFLMVECRCSEEEVRRRLSHRATRGDSPSDADWNIYLEQRRRYEALAPDEEADRLVLDTVAPAADLTAVIEAELRRRSSVAPPE